MLSSSSWSVPPGALEPSLLRIRLTPRLRRVDGSVRGIRKVSSTAPLKTSNRGGGGRMDEVSGGEGEGRLAGERDRGRAVVGRGSCTESKLGTRTISSVSKVRASKTWRTDVC